jgi:hypothetical protein
MQIVAWHGVVTMHQAAWGDEAGSTVTFKLPMADHESDRNPFQSFTKRRKGTAGTRFYMAVSTVESAPKKLYDDEVMLAGWNDSQQNGHTVKFWLCNDGMGHPFEGIGRKTELALALSELDDDNEPIDQKMRDKVEAQVDTGRQKLSNVAAMLCRQEEFWEWLNDNELILTQKLVVDDESAAALVRAFLGINSRAELDTNETIATMFHRKIREPYQEWYKDTIGTMC